MNSDAKYGTAEQDISKHFVDKKMLYSRNESLCPHCRQILRYYEGLRICYCKFCGGKIRRY